MLTEAILIEHNKRLRERVEELEETVRQLRENSAVPVIGPLPAGTARVTPMEETVLRALLARPEIATKNYLYRALYGEEDHVDIKIVDVMVHRIRRKLPPFVKITTLWGRGYRTEVVNDRLTVPMQAAPDQAEQYAA